MLKKKFGVVTLVCLLCLCVAMLFTACGGTQGEKGDKGESGADGKDGVSIVSVEKTDSEGLTDTYTITFSDGSKTTFTVTNGKDGIDGSDGADGEDGTDGETPYIGENGNWWIGSTDTKIPAKGQDGSDGSDGSDGQDGITPHIGENGNWFIGSTDTKIPAKGQNGSDGKDGISITKVDINENGELVISFSEGSPVNLGKVVGADGADGQDGADGISIKDATVDENGNLILTFSDDTTITAGKVKGENGVDGKDGVSVSGVEINGSGELVISFSDGKTNNLGKIIGANGKDGVGIANIELDEEYNLTIYLTEGEPIKLGYIRGEKGEPGTTWLTGEGKPSDDIGKIGDVYLDTETSDLYQKTDSGWGDIPICNIKGSDGSDGEDGKSAFDIWLEAGNKGTKEEFLEWLKGAAGENGKDGATWISGSGYPEPDIGRVNDFYLDEKTGDIFKKVENGWDFILCMKSDTLTEIVSIDGFTKEGEYKFVYNETITSGETTTDGTPKIEFFSFANRINVNNSGQLFYLYRDNGVLLDNIEKVPVSYWGVNTYYLRREDNLRTYTIEIYRLHKYDVSVKNHDGTDRFTETLEENQIFSFPEPEVIYEKKFMGWKNSETGEMIENPENGILMDKNYTFEPVYKEIPRSFTIKFEGSEHEDVIVNYTYYDEAKYDEFLSNFDSYFTCGNQYYHLVTDKDKLRNQIESELYNETLNKEYTIEYRENTGTVTFHYGNGSESTTQDISVSNNTVLFPKDPTKTGYDFKGWSLSENGEAIEDISEYEITLETDQMNISFYAVWSIQTFEVIYNFSTDSGTISTVYKEDGEKLDQTITSIDYFAVDDFIASLDSKILYADGYSLNSLGSVEVNSEDREISVNYSFTKANTELEINENGEIIDFPYDYVGKVIIPDYYNGKPVTSIGIRTEEGNFVFGSGVTEVFFGDFSNITAIRSWAFFEVENIVLPKSVEIVERNSFISQGNLTQPMRIYINHKIANFKEDFSGCEETVNVYFYGTEAQWNEMTENVVLQPEKVFVHCADESN